MTGSYGQNGRTSTPTLNTSSLIRKTIHNIFCSPDHVANVPKLNLKYVERNLKQNKEETDNRRNTNKEYYLETNWYKITEGNRQYQSWIPTQYFSVWTCLLYIVFCTYYVHYMHILHIGTEKFNTKYSLKALALCFLRFFFEQRAVRFLEPLLAAFKTIWTPCLLPLVS